MPSYNLEGLLTGWFGDLPRPSESKSLALRFAFLNISRMHFKKSPQLILNRLKFENHCTKSYIASSIKNHIHVSSKPSWFSSRWITPNGEDSVHFFHLGKHRPQAISPTGTAGQAQGIGMSGYHSTESVRQAVNQHYPKDLTSRCKINIFFRFPAFCNGTKLQDNEVAPEGASHLLTWLMDLQSTQPPFTLKNSQWQAIREFGTFERQLLILLGGTSPVESISSFTAKAQCPFSLAAAHWADELLIGLPLLESSIVWWAAMNETPNCC